MTVSIETPQLVCLDCSATGTNNITHDSTCPAMTGLHDVCAVDRTWFDRHPTSRWRWRDCTHAERVDLALVGVHVGSQFARVLVTDLGDGHHRRQVFAGRVLVADILDVPPAGGWRR